MDECWITKLATWVRSRVAAGLPTGYSVLGVKGDGNPDNKYVLSERAL